jgi:hypothetical protein
MGSTGRDALIEQPRNESISVLDDPERAATAADDRLRTARRLADR